MKFSTKKITLLSLLVAVAMILSYIESLIPPLAAIPGVKIGLSNIATLFALYALGWRSAACVSLVRVCLSALLFGNFVGFIYSLSGAIFALAVMIFLTRLPLFSTVGVSVAGGVMHNAGQVLAAALVMRSGEIVYYLAPLAVSGTLAGVAVGIAGGLLAARLKGYI